MDKQEIKKAGGNRNLSSEIATRSTDPDFYGALSYLPNPDPILRKMNKGQEVFDAIIADSHVIGELRSIRSGLILFEHRVQAGGEDAADLRAAELCEMVMARKPAEGMQWTDLFWNMQQSVFRGYQAHEVVWGRVEGWTLPIKIVDRPQRRFVFSTENELRLKTKLHPVVGEELAPYKWLTTRHMPSYTNPYGVALLSSCFWPYMFKHNGFRFFVKFCEKYGIPWAVGKYPMGTSKEQQNELANALANMVEDAVAAIPDDGSVELIEASSSGTLVHEQLIKVCNSEMSKALTSQTLATEIQGEGSRAASETHRDREQSVNGSDRIIVCNSMNELFAWMTEINIPGAKPPTFEFYEEAEARKDWVEVLKDARDFVDVPKQFAHERLQIPMAAEGEEVLPRSSAPTPASEFTACPNCGTHDFEAEQEVDALTDQAATEADNIIIDMAAPIRELLERSKTLQDFQVGLTDLYPKIDDNRLGELTKQAMTVGFMNGMDEA